MALTTTTKNSEGQSRLFTASHLDDAGTSAVSFAPGFRPRYVRVENVTDRIAFEWFDGMALGDYLKTVAAGTKTLETDDVLTVTVAEGSAPAIALSAVGTNKQYRVQAMA